MKTEWILLQSEDQISKRGKLHAVATSNNIGQQITCHTYSITSCLHHMTPATLSTHPVHGTMCMQHHTKQAASTIHINEDTIQ